MMNFAILTISDKGSRGEREDLSGLAIREKLEPLGGQVVKYDIVPDEVDIISARMVEWADGGNVDVIFSTGGTGLGPRDVTPEATLSVVDRLVPGIVEAVRMETLKITPMAMLSRAVAGLRKKCLIVNLPGSPKAVRECLDIILPAIPHAVDIIKGTVTEHKPADTGRG